MDRLLFGDNQFFGVNHMSEEKARAQAMRFQSIDAVVDVLDAAYDEGVRTFMCTTHDRIAEICDRVRANPDRYADFTFFPCMPYAHKYANAVTENGMLGALKRFLPDEGLMDAAIRGGASMAKKDIEGITTLLIDAEMKMFGGLRTPVVFLQNVVVDLLLGLGFKEAFRIFARHVAERYDAVAMSVFASGAIPADEAIEWVCNQPNVEAIVFGASSRTNIHSTRELVAQHWRN